MEKTPEQAQDDPKYNHADIKLLIRTVGFVMILATAIFVPKVIIYMTDHADYIDTMKVYSKTSGSHAQVARYYQECKKNKGLFQKTTSDHSCLMQTLDAVTFDKMPEIEHSPLLMELRLVTDTLIERRKRGLMERVFPAKAMAVVFSLETSESNI